MNRTSSSSPPLKADLDLRMLPPPEPLQRALEAAEALAGGGKVTVLTRFRPAFLFEELDARGLAHQSASLGDAGWRTVITRPPGSTASTPEKS